MSILDWFRNQAGHFDTDRLSAEMVQWAVDKAITLTNPRLKLLPNCHKRLAPSVETTIRFLQGLVKLLPAIRRMSPETWSADPTLRAFFCLAIRHEGRPHPRGQPARALREVS